jgi:hypothetical protein
LQLHLLLRKFSTLSECSFPLILPNGVQVRPVTGPHDRYALTAWIWGAPHRWFGGFIDEPDEYDELTTL